MKKLILWSLFILLIASGCRDIFGRRIRGNGHITTETRNSSSFHGVDVSGAVLVYVRQDASNSIKVEADNNLLEYVETYNNGGILHIQTRDGVNMRPSRKVRVYLSAPDFSYFEASGACDIISENKIDGNSSIDIDLSGASDIKMELNAPSVSAELSGAGTISLKGETKDFKVSGSGSTDIKCFDLMTENTDVRISGAGDAEVNASVHLDVHVTGAGSVKYKGNATVSQSVSGAGSVKKID